ncbi:hypothetical protein KFE25_009240 [Diacronema lutheri]|uniref:Exonuclease domain-containing protein n=1 Tax=Diacronema lutheri TaxID=2081491 RepID=A0A8J5XUH0_DIALT|nr:hypothetical protein KFE25_009240 [Diacronema lutheri]
MGRDAGAREPTVFFFSHTHGPFACLSNWYPCAFVDEASRAFANSEQAMMHGKAVLFGDAATAEKILRETDPRKVKRLGRCVANFDEDLWRERARPLVMQILTHKFAQNAHEQHVLLSTGNKLLVEASPYDAIWGIGLDAESARQTPTDRWPGSNWLGEVLCAVRTQLRAATGGVQPLGRPAAGSSAEGAEREAVAPSHLLVLDFEATCDEGERRWAHEIIEFPAVLLEREGMRTVDEFRTMVRPTEVAALRPFCTQLTSITQEQVDGAPTLDEVLPSFERWLEGHGLCAEQVLPVTCGDWDLGTCLPKECARKGLSAPRVLGRWCNIKHAFSAGMGVPKAFGMVGASTSS